MNKDVEAGILNTYRCKDRPAQTQILAPTLGEAKKSFGCATCDKTKLDKGKCYGPKMLNSEPIKERPSEPAEPTPEPQAIKHDAGKARFSLLPPKPLMELIQVFTTGAEKYGEGNWQKGLKWIRTFDAVQRHLWAWRSGENKDPEDGLSHLSHAAWGMFALMEYARTHPEMDDR